MYKSRALMSRTTSARLLIAFFVLAGAAQGAATRQGDLCGGARPECTAVAPGDQASADQFPTPEPPALDSVEFARAFNEVKRLGGCGANANAVAGALDDDGSLTPTTRTSEQPQIQRRDDG